jgi:hypothetical protein
MGKVRRLSPLSRVILTGRVSAMRRVVNKAIILTRMLMNHSSYTNKLKHNRQTTSAINKLKKLKAWTKRR